MPSVDKLDSFLPRKLILVYLFSTSLQEGPQRKKRKSEAVEASEQLDLLAIGTAVGSILLYSTIKGELQSKLVSICNIVAFLLRHIF